MQEVNEPVQVDLSFEQRMSRALSQSNSVDCEAFVWQSLHDPVALTDQQWQLLALSPLRTKNAGIIQAMLHYSGLGGHAKDLVQAQALLSNIEEPPRYVLSLLVKLALASSDYATAKRYNDQLRFCPLGMRIEESREEINQLIAILAAYTAALDKPNPPLSHEGVAYLLRYYNREEEIQTLYNRYPNDIGVWYHYCQCYDKNELENPQLLSQFQDGCLSRLLDDEILSMGLKENDRQRLWPDAKLRDGTSGLSRDALLKLSEFLITFGRYDLSTREAESSPDLSAKGKQDEVGRQVLISLRDVHQGFAAANAAISSLRPQHCPQTALLEIQEMQAEVATKLLSPNYDEAEIIFVMMNLRLLTWQHQSITVLVRYLIRADISAAFSKDEKIDLMVSYLDRLFYPQITDDDAIDFTSKGLPENLSVVLALELHIYFLKLRLDPQWHPPTQVDYRECLQRVFAPLPDQSLLIQMLPRMGKVSADRQRALRQKLEYYIQYLDRKVRYLQEHPHQVDNIAPNKFRIQYHQGIKPRPMLLTFPDYLQKVVLIEAFQRTLPPPAPQLCALMMRLFYCNHAKTVDRQRHIQVAQYCESLLESYRFSLCANEILKYLRTPKTNIKPDSPAYGLMRELSPLVKIKFEDLVAQSLTPEKLRNSFCSLFEMQYLKPTVTTSLQQVVSDSSLSGNYRTLVKEL